MIRWRMVHIYVRRYSSQTRSARVPVPCDATEHFIENA